MLYCNYNYTVYELKIKIINDFAATHTWKVCPRTIQSWDHSKPILVKKTHKNHIKKNRE